MTKVTYYMYSCDTSCKIREMMEMNGLDYAKCQKSKEGTWWELFELLMIIRRKMNSVHLLHFEHKWAVAGWVCVESEILDF